MAGRLRRRRRDPDRRRRPRRRGAGEEGPRDLLDRRGGRRGHADRHARGGVGAGGQRLAAAEGCRPDPAGGARGGRVADRSPRHHPLARRSCRGRRDAGPAPAGRPLLRSRLSPRQALRRGRHPPGGVPAGHPGAFDDPPRRGRDRPPAGAGRAPGRPARGRLRWDRRRRGARLSPDAAVHGAARAHRDPRRHVGQLPQRRPSPELRRLRLPRPGRPDLERRAQARVPEERRGGRGRLPGDPPRE